MFPSWAGGEDQAENKCGRQVAFTLQGAPPPDAHPLVTQASWAATSLPHPAHRQLPAL